MQALKRPVHANAALPADCGNDLRPLSHQPNTAALP